MLTAGEDSLLVGLVSRLDANSRNSIAALRERVLSLLTAGEHSGAVSLSFSNLQGAVFPSDFRRTTQRVCE